MMRNNCFSFPQGLCGVGWGGWGSSLAPCHELEGSGLELRWWREIFCATRPSKPALGPTQPPAKYVVRLFSAGKALATHLHLAPRLWMSGVTPPLPLCTCLASYGMSFTFTVREKLLDGKCGLHFFISGASIVSWFSAEIVTVGWFAGRDYTNHSKR